MEEQVAFVGDIKAKFYQAWISKCQQSMLRFLWWEDNEFGYQPTDQNIFKHFDDRGRGNSEFQTNDH